jgi:HTH-type transcriptional regulator / antitoxin HipB
MNNVGDVQMVEFHGERFVIMPEAAYNRLVGKPSHGKLGLQPAVAAMRSVMGNDIVKDRERIGWSQAELARRAGIRVETLNRIETGKRSPSLSTIEKIDAALQSAKKSGKRS